MPKRLQPQLQPSRLQRLWREAWSDVWGYFTIAVAGISSSFSYLGGIVNNSSVQAALDKISLPVWAGLIIAVIGAVTVISAEHPAGNS